MSLMSHLASGVVGRASAAISRPQEESARQMEKKVKPVTMTLLMMNTLQPIGGSPSNPHTLWKTSKPVRVNVIGEP